MFDQNSNDQAQFNALLNDLRTAAHHARNGNSRDSEIALRNVANVPPAAVVQLSLAAMSDVTQSFPPQPNTEPAAVGPFLMLVAARLLHGGLARDWDGYWSSRIDQLRQVRASLEGHVKHQALHSSWLAPAVNEVAVAWAVLLKMMIVASCANQNGGGGEDFMIRTGSSGDNIGNNNSNNNSSPTTFFTKDSLSVVTNEWCAMVSSVPNSPGTAHVYCSILRQAVEECGIIGGRPASLGRGMPLECHDSLREAIFEHVLPTFLQVTAEMILRVSFIIEEEGQYTDIDAQSQRIRSITRLIEILFAILSWGPSIFSAEFGLDRVPHCLLLPARRFRRCIFCDVGEKFDGSSSSAPAPANIARRLLLPEAVLAAFRIGIQFEWENELVMPAVQCLIQLCSIQVTAGAGASSIGSSPGRYESSEEQQQQQEAGPDEWQPHEAARWVYEMAHSLLSVCGYQILNNYLPDPMAAGGSSSGGGAAAAEDFLVRNEHRIETGGSILRSLAVACGRLTTYNIQEEVLCFPRSISDFPDNVMLPLREFAVKTIQYAHDLSVAIRTTTMAPSGSGGGGEVQVEEVFTEAIDALLNAWRDVVRIGLDQSTCRARLVDTPLYPCIVSCARTVFETFVNSRVNFARVAAGARNNENNNFKNNQKNNAATRGLVASSIASHGLDWTRSQINTVGLLGRHDTALSCKLISDHLGPTVGSYLEALRCPPTPDEQQRFGGGGGGSSGGSAGGGSGPDFFLNESVWYLFEIMAWVLTDDEVNSTEIPQPIISLALQVEKNAVEAEQHNDDDPRFWAEVERQVPVFALIRGTFHFCDQLMEATNSHSTEAQIIRSRISPLIVTALLGLFRRFSHAYIDPSTESYEGYSRVFSLAFDNGVAAATAILNFLSWSICWFNSESDAMKEAGELLYALASKPNIGEWIMADQKKSGVLAAAAAGDDQSNMLLRAQLPGEHRGALAGAIVSACSSDSMFETAMGFLDYYVKGFASPIQPNNYRNVAETVASISNLFSHAKCVHHLGVIVNTVHPYLRAVVEAVTEQTAPPDQHYALLSNLLEVFLNGIEICSFNLSTEIIGWMLQSSVKVINIVSAVVRHSVANVLPRLPSQEARQEEEQQHLRMLKASTSLILCAAQWGNLNFAEVQQSGMQSSDERANVVGTLCVDGMLLVLREARHTDLIEVPDLNSVVFRLLSEVAQTHTEYFLSVSNEDSAVLLDATHWALRNSDPQLVKYAFAIIEAITVAPNAAQRMPGLLSNFLSSCMETVVNGGAVEPSILVSLANATFALGCTLGPDMVLEKFIQAVGNQPLLAREGVGMDNRYVRLFVDSLRDVMWQQGRRQRRLFSPVLRRVVMTVRCANIFN